MTRHLARHPRAAGGTRPAHSALLLAILSAFAHQASAQTTPAAPAPVGNPTIESGASLSYVGSRSRVGIGYDRDTKARGEFSHVLSEDALSAFIAQGWMSKRSGGVRVDYNWIAGSDGKPSPDSLVRKLFGAFDRNQDGDRKLTIGFGLESERWFGNLTYSHGLSDKRYIESLGTTTETTQQSGVDAGRAFIDTITTTSSTRLFERAYEHGIGVRAGHFYVPALLRLSLGLDREWGDFSSHQNTVSVDLEKYFSGSPHSVALHLERYNKSGEYETRSNDTRVQVMYRYSFGGSNFADSAGWRQTRTTRQMPVETPVAQAAPAPVAPPPAMQAKSESRIVKTTATMTSDAFFELDRATLTPTARRELDRIAEMLKSNGHSGNVRIVGHTCDLGSDAYNMRLSLRRAEAVRDYLVSRGAGSADSFITEGMGERDPKYPNTRDMRPKNRRVDLEFIQHQDAGAPVAAPPAAVKSEPAPPSVREVPVVEWKTEVIESEPAWVRRALHNTVRHKQTVDTYRGADVDRTSSTTRAFGNRPPVAQDDAVTIAMDAAATISVLANDSDPDGNALSVASVGTPAHGTAVVSGNAVVYTPSTGYSGSDSFSYTVDDGFGGTASARVAVTITSTGIGTGGNRPPVAVNDRYLVRYEGDNPLPVLTNDTDPDGDALSIVSFTQPGLGTITQSGNQLVYTGAGKFTLQTITYTISDGRGGSATATVELVDP